MSDLISREALRKAFHERIYYFDKSSWDEANALIDNAPTVAVNCKDCDGYEAGYSAGLKDAERPQGEWIKGREISRTMLGYKVEHIEYKDYTCSNCGLVLDNLLYSYDGTPFYKFCPNCGAEMKGGADNGFD